MSRITAAVFSVSFLACSILRVHAEDAAQEEYKLGQQFTLGNYTYTIAKFEATRRIGSEFSNKKAEDGAKFLVLYYSIRNNAKDTQTVLSDDFNITDVQQRTFTPDSDGPFYLGSDFLLTQLQPGVTKKTATVFELPDDAFVGPLKLVVPEKGIFGTKTAVVEVIDVGPTEKQPSAPKVTETDASFMTEQSEPAQEKPQIKLTAAEAGTKAGIRYGKFLVGAWYVKKNETKKAPGFKPFPSGKLIEKWIGDAANLGYKSPSEQAAYAAAKRQAVDETFQQGTGTKMKWD